ncbi:MAG TPA: PaaI family thioesterase [Gemmatimonadales bacterium]|nr:PaaI family thioesterase [Gemmatimonadales bacterium]
MTDEGFVPRNPHFEAAVRESFARQSLMATLGARLARVVPGAVDVMLPYSAALCQQNGFLHAGVTASVADSANGYAAYTLAPPGTDVLAVEFKINLLAPARGSHFVACGRVVRPGRTLTVCLAEVFAHDGAERTLVATMLSTIIIRSAGEPGRRPRP